MEQARDDQQIPGHYALVSYISDPLAAFLNNLSVALVPASQPHAHVTILPPRPYTDDLNEALSVIGGGLRNFEPFTVEMGEVEIFPVSNVVYFALNAGSAQLRALYQEFNRDCLEYQEMFPYHPHVTIAQGLTGDQAEALAREARIQWARYEGVRSFRVEVLAFVRNDAPLVWTDVAQVEL